MPSLSIRPGINRVSAEDYTAVKDAFDAYVERKEIVVMNKDNDDLKGNESTVLGMISRTGDVELLRDWHEAKDAKGSPAHSKTVKKAIETQVEALKIKKQAE